MSPPSPTSHLLLYPTPLGVTEPKIRIPCIIQQISIGYLILHMVIYMFQFFSLSLSHPLLLPPPTPPTIPLSTKTWL